MWALTCSEQTGAKGAERPAEVEGEKLVGMEQDRAVITNPAVWTDVIQSRRQGTADGIRCAGGSSFESTAANGVIPEFRR
jgi:hypothetical protein